MKVLVVEDEAEIAERLRAALEKHGYIVETARDGATAWFKGQTEEYDAILLDLSLPKLDGLEVIKRLRQADVSTPILALTARAAWTERVAGIDAGADDYVPKPFQMEEVVARLRAITRRAARQLTATLTVGELVIDTRQMDVAFAGRPVVFTALEFRALHYLARNHGRVISQGELIEHVYASESEPDSNAVEVLIGRLRRKLSKSFIATRRGMGYYLDPSSAAEG
ncbi:MAG: response regulator transcription factor [Pseudomonadota bacterium]|nr:response regulator transcription factor [Pseudomonadota bacterium]